MGIEVVVEGLTKSFGSHVVWQDVSLSLPASPQHAFAGSASSRRGRQRPGGRQLARRGRLDRARRESSPGRSSPQIAQRARQAWRSDGRQAAP